MNIVYLSGLPRTGSTVLSSMLNQHPSIHATTTSPLADLVSIILDSWPAISKAQVNPHPGQYAGIINGVVDGAHRWHGKKYTVDKNRLWPRFAPQLQQITGVKPKIICTVRSITEIMASYILLIERNKPEVTFIDKDLIEAGLPINNKNRCEVLLSKYIKHPYDSLRIGHNSGAADMVFVEYSQVVGDGQNTADRLCDFIGCGRFKLDTQNLQRMDENDEWHGGIRHLHEVRPVLQRTSPDPVDILGLELYNRYSKMKLEFWRK